MVGKAILVRVNFTDDNGNEYSLTSNALAIPPPLIIPDNVGISPQITIDDDALSADVSAGPPFHDGATAFTFELRFSEDISMGYRTMRDHVLTITGGSVTGARRLDSGSNAGWEIRVEPTGNDDVVITLPVTTDCEAEAAVCTEDGRMLSEPVQITVAGPDLTGDLTAAASNAPSSHDGSTEFTFELRFSQNISMGYKTMRDHVLDVTGGKVTGARRLVSGSSIAWEIRVQPTGNNDVVITLPVTTDCEAEGADGRMLSEEVELTVSGPGG